MGARTSWVLLLGCLAPAPASADDPAKKYEGKYRVVAMPADLRIPYAIIKIEGGQDQPRVTVLDVAKSLPSTAPSISPTLKVNSTEATVSGNLLRIVLHTTLGDWNLEVRHDWRVNGNMAGSLHDTDRLQPVFLVPTAAHGFCTTDPLPSRD